jgi:D-lactate dehydrogenase
MDVAVFSSKKYDREYLQVAFASRHRATFFDTPLSTSSVNLANGKSAICAFVNDDLGRDVLTASARIGVRLVTLRCTGFNNVDLNAAKELGIRIARVPAYSPHAVAEHAIGLILALNRKIHRAFNRVRENNFSLDGLLGFDLFGKTVGIVGTGEIGSVVARILIGFGCNVIATDPSPNAECQSLGVRYVSWETLCAESRIITLHCPLTPQTRHLVNVETIARMKPDVMLVNTSRGAVIDTRAIIQALKTNHVGSLAMDVYEEEAHLFFDDMSDRIVADDVFSRLLTFPNVLITGHQGFFTHEALTKIAATTAENLTAFEATGVPVHEIAIEKVTVSKPLLSR